MRRILLPSGRGFRDFVPLRLLDANFFSRFATEEACRDFLFRSRWPHGFECGFCGGAAFKWLDTRRLLCRICRRKTALTAGTILHGTRKPLRLWFRAAFLFVQGGANARTLQEQLGLTYKVAWAWGHKLRALLRVATDAPDDAPPAAIPGAFKWEAWRPGGLGGCCERLDARDWAEPMPPGFLLGWGRRRLFVDQSGSVSDKHLVAYLEQTEFRLNHRTLPPAVAAERVLSRFADVRPSPYAAIRGGARRREALRIRSVRPPPSPRRSE